MPRQAHRAATGVLSAAMVVIGIAMIVITISEVGLQFRLGYLLGALFVALGTGRLYLQRRTPDA